jgi:hypothetical protein
VSACHPLGDERFYGPARNLARTIPELFLSMCIDVDDLAAFVRDYNSIGNNIEKTEYSP